MTYMVLRLCLHKRKAKMSNGCGGLRAGKVNGSPADPAGAFVNIVRNLPRTLHTADPSPLTHLFRLTISNETHRGLSWDDRRSAKWQ
jgi:hypothetical protein